MRPLLIAGFGTALAGMAAWSMAGVVAMGKSHAVGANSLMPAPHVDRTSRLKAHGPVAYVSTDKFARPTAPKKPVIVARLDANLGTSARHAGATVVAASANAARFDAVARKAAVSSAMLASLFGPSTDAQLAQTTVAAPAQPANTGTAAPTVLAYAAPSPGATADAALSALLTAPTDDERAAARDEDIASLPVFEDTPSVAPVPQLRPQEEQPAAKLETPAAPKAEEQSTKPKTLAYARPDAPAEKKPKSRSLLGDLFGGKTRAGKGVAVYDISAAKVYMPDGSVLEAHSGIGKMADNPRYAHVKMNGPTPPHTYNLRMRESRFHGVEAIRMLPVDGKNKFGRDGFLTHSYLLRGGREESHGCVAFEDYNRFLNAFKQGKVKQLIVVPSGGRESFRLASS
ncbi:DUF2778 domain-containing protein [Aminobacter sp. HY435]|uniref:DUF2778 domain-containing protein n=1 Tax=Aminobacter sp. HY435 TaxID=2970917 RepID=UPI0022B949B7|nr:tlde1 domain-containing protein [Aminobacter sp. HY435]